jgi:hypothetical protein
MKKFCLALLVLLAILPASNLIVVNNNIDLGPVSIDSGFYGEQRGNITLVVTTTDKPVVIYAEIFRPLTSGENFQLPADGLQYQVYWWTGKDVEPFRGEILNGATGRWLPYRRGGTPIARIREGVPNYEIQLGTTIRRVPSVQPTGRYDTTIRFWLEEEF